jgi:hypothetical protein
MAIRLRGFSQAAERAIEKSLALIRQRLGHSPSPMPHDLRLALHDIVSGARPTVTLAFGGSTEACRDLAGRTAGYRVVLCPRAFAAGKSKRTRLTAVLFHELIHVARGKELDSEAFENAWFSDEGAREPTRADWAAFAEDAYRGWWVHLDPRSRRVTDYSDRFIVTFPKPTAERFIW